MAELQKTSEDVIQYFENIEKNLAHAFDVKYVFVTNDKSKKLIKVSKLSDPFLFLLNAHILVTFNEKFFENFDDQEKEILISQELDKIECDAEKGQVKINSNPLISTSSGIIEKFTLELVKNANKLEREYLAQLKEKEKEEKAAKGGGKKGRKRF
jgi:hypothetical protein